MIITLQRKSNINPISFILQVSYLTMAKVKGLLLVRPECPWRLEGSEVWLGQEI